MPYSFVADSIHTKKLCSRLSSSEVHFYMANGCFTFLSPFEGLGATYDVYVRLIRKCIVDFLLVLTELLLLDVMAEALRVNIDCKLAFLLQQG